MPVFKALELCTNQMLPSDAEILSGYSVTSAGRQRPLLERGGKEVRGSLIVDPIGEYGWTISLDKLQCRDEGEVIDFIQALADEGFSEHFIKALEGAAGQGMDAIRFDCNVEPEPGFPEFDWENDHSSETDVVSRPAM